MIGRSYFIQQVLNISWKLRLLSLLLMGIAEGDMFACHSLYLQIICLQLFYCGFFIVHYVDSVQLAAPAFCTLAGS